MVCCCFSDSGQVELPEGESLNYLKVEPYGGTLARFYIPHEMLETNLER